MPKRLTQEEVERRVLDILGDEYHVLGKYINKETKIEIKHDVCGKIFMKKPGDIFSKGSRCPYCYGNKQLLHTEEWVRENTPKPYEYVKGYTKMREKCYFKCNKCGDIFLQTPSRIITDGIYGCKCSYVTKRKTHKDFLQSLGEMVDEYEFLEKYKNDRTPIKVKHKKCDSVFEIVPDKMIRRYHGIYCPVCYHKKSKGEILISAFLQKNNINHKREYICYENDNKYIYDFYLPQDNTFIEFDGKQHFEYNEFFHRTEENFEKRKQQDLQKNIYCLKNNYCLYRIPYTDIDNIDQILTNILIEKSSTTIEKYLVTE